MDYIRLNVMAPVALASWARQAGVKMLHLSGGIVYQHSSGRKLSEGDAIGYSGQGGTYGSSKLLAEIGLRPEVDLGLDLTVIRPSSLYGRRDLGLGLVSRLLSEAMQDGTITINEPTTDRINLVHVDDVARAVALLIDNECNGAFNVSSSTQTLLEIATTCADVCGIDGVRVRPSISAARPGRHALDLSTAKIEAAVQWRPQVTLMEGLSQMRDTLLLAPKPSAAI
jgi:nucleoside-diphosphate-sugar epimerase